MAVFPNSVSAGFCNWILVTKWLGATSPQKVVINLVLTAANTSTSVSDNTWNDFLRFSGLWYQYYVAYINQTTNIASLPSGIVQGDLLYGSAANTLSRLAKSTATNNFLKNSGTSNNPAWSSLAMSDLPNFSQWTDYTGTSTIVGWSSFTTKVLQYYKFGSLLFLQVNFVGTSNSTSVTFTIPVTGNANTGTLQWSAAMNNLDAGTVTGGFAEIAASGSTVTVFKDFPRNNWTNTGTKATQGFLIFALPN